MIACDTKAVVDWLTDGARSQSRPEMVLADLCDQLVKVGIPLWRVAVFVRTLHPEIMGRRFIWQPDVGVTITEGSFDLLERDQFLNSPFVAVINSGQTIRRQLSEQNNPEEFSIFRELRADGATDYLATPLIFTNGSVHVATWSTQQAGGFTETQIAAIETIVKPFARVAEIRALQRTATNLLDTYVGHHAGERILAGRIRRGHTETIHSVIWLSDMRGFTSMADRLSHQKLVDLLNRYFDCQVPAILRHGGEVLKFIGDGLLAIFPLAKSTADAREACDCALAAAREAQINIDAIDTLANLGSENGVRFGLALHIGEVLYGNIGSGNRLDFTCIGPAVNLAARLEKLAANLGRTIILSAEFAQHSRRELEHLGEFVVAGFTAKQKAFGLPAGSR
ncbi:MAG TPA: adenylate/guanylate cyclase domain-containing protein [Pseudolabrys sp.]|jgi:adenylate cyclase|nr:adenylate/guanylate cyclase domain-containing protein [Pseudolabrys sp.]